MLWIQRIQILFNHYNTLTGFYYKQMHSWLKQRNYKPGELEYHCVYNLTLTFKCFSFYSDDRRNDCKQFWSDESAGETKLCWQVGPGLRRPDCRHQQHRLHRVLVRAGRSAREGRFRRKLFEGKPDCLKTAGRGHEILVSFLRQKFLWWKRFFFTFLTLLTWQQLSCCTYLKYFTFTISLTL